MRICAHPGLDLSRRCFLKGSALALWALALPPLRAAAEPYLLPQATRDALSGTSLVYISPLKSDGSESRCHGEVWFTVDQGDVLIFTSKDTWKTKALSSGLRQARIWAGDFGPVGKAGDRFRQAPNFLSSAEFDTDPAAFERLMTAFADSYASEWGRWGPRFRKGWESGSRALIRYRPRGA